MSQSCDRIINGLRDSSIQVHIIHFTNRAKSFKTVINEGGTYTACLKSDDLAHSLHLTLNFLEKFIEKYPCDLVLVFGGLLPLTAGPVYSQLLNLPLYTCFRGNDFDVSLFSFKRRAMLMQCINSSKGVFAVSRDKVKRLKIIASGIKVYYSPNSIDLSTWLPLKSELEFSSSWRLEKAQKHKTVLGIFGYLKKKKGIYAWLEALVVSRRVNNIHLLMSGELEDHVIDLLDQYQIEYTQMPFLDRTELIKYYLACDWVVIPSFYDGLPNVLLEAGGLGIPVIASEVDGMKDIIINQENGLLFDPLNMESASTCIKLALSLNRQERIQLGENLKQLIFNNYTVTQEVTNYVHVFKKALNNNEKPTIFYTGQ